MLPGDVITAVHGRPVRNVAEMMTAVAALVPGEAAPFTVQRGAQALHLEIVPSTRPSPQRAQRR